MSTNILWAVCWGLGAKGYAFAECLFEKLQIRDLNLVLVGDTGYTDERHLYGNPPIRNSISRRGLQINVYHARQAATFSNSKWQEKKPLLPVNLQHKEFRNLKFSASYFSQRRSGVLNLVYPKRPGQILIGSSPEPHTRCSTICPRNQPAQEYQ